MPLRCDGSKVMQQLAPKSCADAFWVKLHSVEGQAGVGNCLHNPVSRLAAAMGSLLQTDTQRFRRE